MASRGLWLPLALRTNSMADGTPATVNVAVSCEAGLASGMVGMPSNLAESISLAKTSGCEGATSADVRAPRSKRTPRFCPTSFARCSTARFKLSEMRLVVGAHVQAQRHLARHLGQSVLFRVGVEAADGERHGPA